MHQNKQLNKQTNKKKNQTEADEIEDSLQWKKRHRLPYSIFFTKLLKLYNISCREIMFFSGLIIDTLHKETGLKIKLLRCSQGFNWNLQYMKFTNKAGDERIRKLKLVKLDAIILKSEIVTKSCFI